MITANYISTNSNKYISGGGASVSASMFRLLASNYNVNYVGPIQSNRYIAEELISKIIRKLGFKANYFFFSESRLQNIANQVKQFQTKNADFHFYDSPTSWIKTKNDKPYFVYLDACFATYVSIFNILSQFRQKDLQRIYTQEKKFLNHAGKVFFRSQWALSETKKAYDLTGNNFVNVGFGGGVEVPGKDNYKGGNYFLFVSKEFIPKGGSICVEAFLELSKKNKTIELYIVGQKPPKKYLQYPGIKYMGFLDKSKNEDREKFRQIFSNALALIHPTTKDVNSLVVTEAAYFGCPVITSKAFALEEFVIDGETGFLLDLPITMNELSKKMEYLLENPKEYRNIRKAARKFILRKNTWKIVEQKVIHHINECIGK